MTINSNFTNYQNFIFYFKTFQNLLTNLFLGRYTITITNFIIIELINYFKKCNLEFNYW